MKYLVEDGKHLPYTDESGKPDHRLMGAAWAALHGGYRGNKYEGPDKDKAIAKLRGIYKSEGMTPPGEETKAGALSKSLEAIQAAIDQTNELLVGSGELDWNTMDWKIGSPIECRAQVEISPTATNEILFLPTGLHAITPVAGGIGRPIKVKIGPESAQAIEEQRRALMAKGKRPYFDFNHEDGSASFWPEFFMWRNGEGVICQGEWSRRGRNAVEGKDFRAFSPVFHVDNKRAEAATVVCKETADPNMGGLVNNPAFKDLPLWAKNAESLGNAGAAGDNADKEKSKMENEELAALRAKQQELQSEVDALRGAAVTTENERKLDANSIALENIQLKIEAAELRSRSALLSEQIQAKNKVEADELIQSAIQRGAILARDFKTQETWRTQLIGDMATFGPLIKSRVQNQQLSTRIAGAGGRVTIQEDEPSLIFGAMAKVLSRSKRTGNHADKSSASKEFAAIYAREFKGANRERMLSFPMSDMESAIMAADVTDSDLGTLSGTLVAQRTLELLKLQFPALTAFTTDFSDQPAQFNQTIMTRIITIPNVSSYDVTTGWTDSDASTADVPITINAHRGIPITFNSNILASTVRRLFDEFSPAQAYALAKDMVDALFVNITDANFVNNTVVTTANFARTSVLAIGTALSLRGVPSGPGMRFLLLYPTVYEKLSSDTSIYTLGAFKVAPIITDRYSNNDQTREFPVTVGGIDCYESANLPTNNGNITGFAGSKSALVIATRVPNDYTSVLPGASFGNVQMVTDPDIGITVMLVQYVNHTLGSATSRISLMYGTAAGQGPAGQLVKAASGSGSGR